MLRVDAWDEKKSVHASTLETGVMHGAEKQGLVHHFLEARAGEAPLSAGGARAGAETAAREGGRPSAGGPKGKDFGHWTQKWNRQVARGAGLRYTRAKDLV